MFDACRLVLVVPCYNEEEVFEETDRRLRAKLETLVAQDEIKDSSHILYVDDGSKDSTWQKIKSSSELNHYTKGLKLAKNVGHQNALIAGMEQASSVCDCLISLDADLQDDIDAIDEMLKRFKEGCEVVYGVRAKRSTDTFFKKVTAEAFYKLMLFMGVDIVFNHADYRLLSRRAVSNFSTFTERNAFIRGIVPLLGFKSAVVSYERNERFAGATKYPLRKMLSFAWDGISSFSVVPLRLITVIGFSICFFSFLMAFYILFVALFTDQAVPGWASTVTPIYFIGGVQLLSVGVLGEYIGKIYKEVKARPRYIIEDEAGDKEG